MSVNKLNGKKIIDIVIGGIIYSCSVMSFIFISIYCYRLWLLGEEAECTFGCLVDWLVYIVITVILPVYIYYTRYNSAVELCDDFGFRRGKGQQQIARFVITMISFLLSTKTLHNSYGWVFKSLS